MNLNNSNKTNMYKDFFAQVDDESRQRLVPAFTEFSL